MATLFVKNVSNSGVYIRDLYRELAPGDEVRTPRPPESIRKMTGLMQAVLDKKVAVAVQFTELELASGFAPEDVL